MHQSAALRRRHPRRDRLPVWSILDLLIWFHAGLGAADRRAAMTAPVAAALGALARNGRVVLTLGLVAGIASPGLAAAARPYIPEMAAGLLYLAALRIGPQGLAIGPRAALAPLGLVLAMQLALPLALGAACLALGLDGPLAGAVILMAAAPSIAGAPSITALAGADPAPAMRLLALGAALLPLTAAPVFRLNPALAGSVDMLAASARLLAVIAGAALLAALTRRLVLPRPSAETLGAIDGLSVVGLAVMVVGLMAAVGPALVSTPGEAMTALALAFAANFGLQLAVFALPGLGAARVGSAVVAGNRNMALFLTALPAAVTDPMLLFIGLYQIPMFLTPLLLGPLYRRAAGG
jgi:ACR3 family arsenite transporter